MSFNNVLTIDKNLSIDQVHEFMEDTDCVYSFQNGRLTVTDPGKGTFMVTKGNVIKKGGQVFPGDSVDLDKKVAIEVYLDEEEQAIVDELHSIYKGWNSLADVCSYICQIDDTCGLGNAKFMKALLGFIKGEFENGL